MSDDIEIYMVRYFILLATFFFFLLNVGLGFGCEGGNVFSGEMRKEK